MQSDTLIPVILMGLAAISADAAGQQLGDPGVIELDGDLVQIEVHKRGVIRGRGPGSTAVDHPCR